MGRFVIAAAVVLAALPLLSQGSGEGGRGPGESCLGMGRCAGATDRSAAKGPCGDRACGSNVGCAGDFKTCGDKGSCPPGHCISKAAARRAVRLCVSKKAAEGRGGRLSLVAGQRACCLGAGHSTDAARDGGRGRDCPGPKRFDTTGGCTSERPSARSGEDVRARKGPCGYQDCDNKGDKCSGDPSKCQARTCGGCISPARLRSPDAHLEEAVGGGCCGSGGCCCVAPGSSARQRNCDRDCGHPCKRGQSRCDPQQ
jgi:hypothetical protein